MPGSAYDGWKDGPGGIVTGEPGLAHAGAVVHHQSGHLVVAHLERVLGVEVVDKNEKHEELGQSSPEE